MEVTQVPCQLYIKVRMAPIINIYGDFDNVHQSGDSRIHPPIGQQMPKTRQENLAWLREFG
jgi:hypothetical protein